MDNTTHGQTPLWWAAANGHEEVVKALLERSEVDPNAADRDGRTPLSRAAENGHEAVVRALFQRDETNLDQADDEDRTPLFWAADGGHVGVVKALLEWGDSSPGAIEDYDRISLTLVRSGHEEVVRLHPGGYADYPKTPDYYNTPPLEWAGRNRYRGLLRVLIDVNDVNPNAADRDDRTPLSRAAGRGHEEVVKILLERDDVNSFKKDRWYRTPFCFAVHNGHEGVVKMLLEHYSADLNSTIDGETPLSLAVRLGHVGIAKLLQDRLDHLDRLEREHQTRMASLSQPAGVMPVNRSIFSLPHPDMSTFFTGLPPQLPAPPLGEAHMP